MRKASAAIAGKRTLVASPGIRSIRELRIAGRVVEVVVRRMRRKTMAIHVFADRPVELRVPGRCSVQAMDAFLESRHDWIADSLASLGPEPPRSPKFRDDEIHWLLGQPLRLRLSEGRRHVSVVGDVLAVRCLRPQEPACVLQTLEGFYRTEALRAFPGRLELCRSRFREPLPPSTLKVRKMSARWGHCSNTGEICLNTALIQKPMAAIDFVVTHELCHLRHFAHNKSFYRLMDRTLPDWRERERLLVADDATLQLDLF